MSAKPSFGCCPAAWRRLLLLWLLCPLASPAVQQLDLRAEQLRGTGWEARGVELQAQLAHGEQLALTLAANALRLETASLELRGLHLACTDFSLMAGGGSRCRQADLAFFLEPWKRVSGVLDWRQDETGLELVVERLALGKGRIRGRLSRQLQRWQVELEAKGLAVQPLLSRLLPQWSGQGTLAASVQGRFGGPDGWRLAGTLESDRLGFSDAPGLHVGERLRGRVETELSGRSALLEGSVKAVLRGGQLYMDPFYVEFDAGAPFSLEARFAGDRHRSQWRLARFSARHPGVFEVTGNGSFRQGGPEALALDYRVSDLGQAYRLLLQPLLIGTALDALDAGGALQGSLRMRSGEFQELALEARRVVVEDGQAHRFGFAGLEGRLNWQRDGKGRGSRLEWRSGHLYRVALGALELRFLALGDRLVVQPFSLALLGGSLRLRDLELEGLLRQGLQWAASATLEGIRLEKVSEALAWPPLQGELNAVIPRVHYRNGLLSLDGELVVEVFGGRVVIEGLQVEDLFGVAPVLETSIRLENLDLARISRTFSFGRIEGSLEGHVRNLRLVGWEVAAFDAELRSPTKDRRPHRISQKAIDNLTELGNGVAAGLSGTFLGMFKDFAYDRLELRVRLEGDTAELDGAPGPSGGYYIVKGARLPRVDVIGRNRRVAWKDLLSRLKQIRFEGVVVE